MRPKLITSLILALFFGIALWLRVYPPYGQVFTTNWIKFTGNDAYYQMHLVDNLVRNFPHLATFSPYLIYPGGQGVGNIHFFNWLLASIIWVISLGSPTQNTIDVIGVYFPAVLGALTVIPVYFIAKELFSRWAGVLSAGLIAILPGEFLGRSMLGFTDQHVAETLFSTITMLFMILAIKTAKQRELSFRQLKRRDWAIIAKPIIYSLLAGLFLAAYFFTWLGALLLFFLLSIYFVIQSIIDHLKGRATDYLCLVGIISLFVTLIIYLGGHLGRFFYIDILYLGSMLIALLTPLVLSVISWLMKERGLKPVYYPLSLMGLGVVGIAIFYFINPSLLTRMFTAFSIFFPTGVALTTTEMQPILFPSGNFSLVLIWGNFTTSFFFSLISLGVLIYLVFKQGDADKTLLVVWSLVMLAATLGQRRFAYYLAVNVALLTGYLSWQALRRAGLKETNTKATKVTKEIAGKRAKRKRSSPQVMSSPVAIALMVVIIFFVVFFWNIEPAIATTREARFAPSDAWCSSLSWLKENTPDPFGNPDAYYYQHETSYKYPESAYGVLAWWDYGYWITRIARRPPNANPSQDPFAITRVANFFLSQEEESAKKIAQELGTAYVIMDYETAISKFWAVATWAGRKQTEYTDIYYVPQEKQLVPVKLFYPEYYRSLSTRFYNFDGKAVTPQGTLVISYQEETSPEGTPYKVITGTRQFASYEEAEAYLLSQASNNYKIVSAHPFISPVPLEALTDYRLIYSSPNSLDVPEVGSVPEVKIFEFVERVPLSKK